MRRLPAGPIRWPGGCFADSYDWRDGVGPRSARPRRTNFWANDMASLPDGPAKYEPNQFGTNDFIRFCRLAGGEPYLAANLRSLPARDFYQWVEFCNSPAGSTTLADLRAGGGDRDPFSVRFWGVGNESWGCGGNFTPEEYATEFRRFTAWMPRYGVDLALIASGPNSGDLSWTRRFLSTLTEKGEGALGGVWGLALHHYSWNVSRGATTDWNAGKGDAINFTTDEWYELLNEADRMDTLISDHWKMMEEIDHRHRVKLVVDEWGAWHRAGTAVDPSHLFGQQSTMRDALLAGLTLDIFQRHADKVAMANVAQLVNCLQSLLPRPRRSLCATPTFHVFEMYGAARRRAGRAIDLLGSAHRLRSRQRQRIVLGSGRLRLAQESDADADRGQSRTRPLPRETEIEVRGGRPVSVAATTIAASDIHAHNTFDAPDTVRASNRAVPSHDRRRADVPLSAGVGDAADNRAQRPVPCTVFLACAINAW